jgi:hypothetical protein
MPIFEKVIKSRENTLNVTHLGIKSHIVCLELCTPTYSLHPKLQFDTDLIFVSLLVPEILAHFFCPSGKFFLEKGGGYK